MTLIPKYTVVSKCIGVHCVGKGLVVVYRRNRLETICIFAAVTVVAIPYSGDLLCVI